MYIDAKKIDKRIFVSERDAEGKRHVWTHRPEYVFYYEDEGGKHTAIDGTKLSRFSDHDYFKFKDARQEWENLRRIYESDIDPVYRLLETRYPGDDGPDLHIQFLDIEVDKDPARGFASINNPYAEINAISIYNKWNDEAITVMVPPKNLTMQEARDLLDGKCFQDIMGNITNVRPEGDDFEPMTEENGFYLVETEAELLVLIIDMMADADVVTGWNSQFFDIPYIIQRMRIVLGLESMEALAMEDGSRENPCSPSEKSQGYINRLNLFPCPPTLRMVEHYGSMEKTYQLHGRVHLDYLDLYRKFTYEELHSYTLDSILQHEVKQNKVAYDGSLDQLYRWDFRRFSAYSRQDTMGLSAIDDKRKMVALANSMAHMAGVTMDKVLGSVTLIEQAILKEMHKKNIICFDKVEKPKNYTIPGAFVLEPQKGEYYWIGAYDFNSLYPTVIRMLNISPECIIGFVDISETLAELNRLMLTMDSAEAWSHFPGTIEYRRVANRSQEQVCFLIEGQERPWDWQEGDDDPSRIYLTGEELNDVIRENDWVITAFGLVLTREFQGIIPYCLEKWYAQRKTFQKKQKAALKKAKESETPEEKAKWLAEEAYYDMLQLVQKIFLNSTYGALLNAFCRFYDPRAGASTTMSGRICLQAMTDLAEDILENREIDDLEVTA